MVSTEVSIRPAARDDVARIAQVHVVAWQVAYRGCMPDSFLDGLNPDRRAQAWSNFLADSTGLLLVALQAQAIVGFVALVHSRDPDALKSTGEVAALYVDPQFWRLGCGAALLDAAIESARQRHYEHLTLWVLDSNRRARSFYEARGFVHDGQKKIDERPGFSLVELRYALSLVDHLPNDPRQSTFDKSPS